MVSALKLVSHKLIDKEDDKSLLKTLFQFLEEGSHQYSGEIWNSLAEDE